MNKVKLANFEIGGGEPLVLIAGPCVLEGLERSLMIGRGIKEITNRLGIPYVFKASFDKANRSAYHSFRGPGMADGLRMLKKIRRELNVPVVTDIHETCQAEPAAKAVDILQIPAFLSRQTDLLHAAAQTGAIVNVKKGQFLSPNDMRNVVDKIHESGSERILRLQHSRRGHASISDHAQLRLSGYLRRHPQCAAAGRRRNEFLGAARICRVSRARCCRRGR